MTAYDWAEHTARSLLAEPLPRRWAHTQGVATRARSLAPALAGEADLIVAAAWLHDIGYSPRLVDTGFHPLDGARHLRSRAPGDDLLRRLVAHHSCASVEADERGLYRTLMEEFRPPPVDLGDALNYCDMTTTPDGKSTSVDRRIAEILERYAEDHPVHRAIDRSAPMLRRSVENVTLKLRSNT